MSSLHDSRPSDSSRRASAVIGLQWGDEGKGKAVDLLAGTHDAVVRFNGGANAGHSIVVRGERFSLHLVPSGILYPGKTAVIGNGVALDPEALLAELDQLAQRGVDTSGLVISSRAHLVMPYHRAEDELREELLKGYRVARAETAEAGGAPVSEIGTTRRGIGPCYADKVLRTCAIRAGDLKHAERLRERVSLACALKSTALQGLSSAAPRFEPGDLLARLQSAATRIGPMIQDTSYLLNGMLDAGRSVLFEAANGSLLDVDHGTYPFVTGSACTIAGVGTGAGVPVHRVGTVLGVMKAYSTRVGAGPMPTELFDATAERIRTRGREFGTTTGRPRRVGWLDLVAVRYAAMLNGVTGLVLTMLDVLSGFDEVRVCTEYQLDSGRTDRFPADGLDLAQARPIWTAVPGFDAELAACRALTDLPAAARGYIDFIQERVGVPIRIVSVGPDRDQTIVI